LNNSFFTKEYQRFQKGKNIMTKPSPAYIPPAAVKRIDDECTTLGLTFEAACRRAASYCEKLTLAEAVLEAAKASAIARRKVAVPQLQVTDNRIIQAMRLEEQAGLIPLEQQECKTLCVDHWDGYSPRWVRSVEWVSQQHRTDLFDRARELRQAAQDDQEHKYTARRRAEQAEDYVVYWETMVAELREDALPEPIAENH
jgi:hypothetical protein